METLTRSRGWFDTHRAEALDVIRMYVGLALVVRGGLFLADPVAYLNLVPESQGDGFLVSGVLMHYVALAHIAGGLLLAVGLATRLAALVQIPVLLGAVLVHLPAGLGAAGQSLELAALTLFLLAVCAVWGSGPWSADAYLERKARTEAEDEARDVAEATRRLRESSIARAPAPDRAHRAPLAPAALPTCSCDHDREHPHVDAERHYNLRGGLTFATGTTGTPSRIVFRCRDCGEVVEDSRDPAVMKAHRYEKHPTEL